MARRPPPPQPQRPSLTVEQKRRCIDRFDQRIKDLEAFDPQKLQKRYNVPEVLALETAVDEALSTAFGHGTVEYQRYSAAATLDAGPHTMRMGPTWGDSYVRDYDAEEALDGRRYIAEGKERSIVLLRQAIRTLQEEIAEQIQESASDAHTSQIKSGAISREVFIVHGHEDGPREAVARFIEKIGLKPIILHERPNRGRTIITKFREEAAGVGFAVVLMTPDDLGRAKEDGDLKLRARQNVIFELGFFIGALRPERVAALVKGEIDLPTDYDGVVYISMDNDDWRIKLAKELQAAEYKIDWNKVMS